MTHIVLPQCINCKYGDCVAVCPVNCFHEGENMVAIDPEACIDCGVCVLECPMEAIAKQDPDNPIHNRWLIINHEAVYKYKWPNISSISKRHPEADKYAQITEKEHLLSTKPVNAD